MRVTRNSKGFVVKEILHESMLEDARLIVDKSGCKGESKDALTKMVVTGTSKQLDKFVTLWNKGC